MTPHYNVHRPTGVLSMWLFVCSEHKVSGVAVPHTDAAHHRPSAS